jgi:DNA-binding NarL/FixJ family response regulator
MEATASPDNNPIRVLLVGDHTVVRVGLKLLIESYPDMTVVGQTGTNGDAVAVANNAQPNIILVDVTNGTDAELTCLPKLLSAAREARALVLTGEVEAKINHRAVELGAMGVIQKTKDPDILIKAIRKVHSGEAWLDRVTTASVLTELSRRSSREDRDRSESDDIALLTKRERDVINLVAQGLKNRQIAERLSISDITVRHHLTSIFGKLGVADRFELIIYAYRHGLCAPPSNNDPRR